MNKLTLVNWNDKMAKDVEKKIQLIENNVSNKQKQFEELVKKVENDNSIDIPYSFNPEEFKV